MISIARRAVNRITKIPKQQLMRRRLRDPEGVAKLNRQYNSLSLEQKRDFYELYSRICRARLKAADYRLLWSIDLERSTLKLPLHSEDLWLHWDSAVSLLGHDLNVKRSYINLLGSNRRPDLFVDIGANYGTHSLLFMSSGVKAVSFEPNPACIDYFLTSCSLNDLEPQLERVALGESRGTVEICFPERETWLGSADPEVIRELQARTPTMKVRAKMALLDDYLPQFRNFTNVLMKIDVEGLEDQVLNGAKRTLAEIQPLIIFECNTRPRLNKVARILLAHDYVIARLPWSDEGASSLTLAEMATTRDTNFLAIPTQQRQALLGIKNVQAKRRAD